jgi:hypothetical protein
MKRAELEHLILVVSSLVRDKDLYVLGSQAILGAFPDAPAELLVSLEADVYPRNLPIGAVLVDDALGERSAFHRTYGYYAHAVAPAICTLPEGWENRLIPVNTQATGEATGWCLDPHDLAISKLASGRKKDVAFVRHLLLHRLVRERVLRRRVALTPVSEAVRRGLLRGLKRAGPPARRSASAHRPKPKSPPKPIPI